MRQNRATSAPFFYCVSYEILRETRIKPSFFGNCLISLFPALGAQCLGSRFAGVAPLAIRALGSWSPVGTVQDRPSRQARRSLPLVLIKRIAHVRGPVPGLSIRALGSWSPVGTVQDRPSRQARRSLPLVLIERIAHVRGGGGLALSVA